MTTQRSIILACSHANATSETSVRRDDGSRAYCCCDCWNAGVAARRAELKAANKERAASGAKFWEARGVRVGETLVRYARHMLNPMIALRVEGIAKAGAAGAYVASGGRQCDPEGWRRKDEASADAGST